MDQESTCCPVCTLYLREGISLQTHLETHPKDKVIEALLKVTSNGAARQTAQSQTGGVSGTSESYIPTQQFVPPNGAYLQQNQNYVNPSTQMASAVTYQPYITNNGSTVMPQYIQVPTIMAPNTSVPMVPNQTLNYVPTQQSAYAHTMYNPLYNPYIPQPYPIVQPVYTSMPVTSEANTQVSTSQITDTPPSSCSNQAPETENTDSALKQVSTVATNTMSEKNITSRIKAKKFPFKSTTQTKFRIIKQLGSRMKTTTSTMATVATKSFRITSINGKNSTAKTSVITTAKSFKTKNRLLLPKPTPSATTSRIISPPPLTPMTSGRSSSVPCSGTPPPPPLSKAPCLTPIPTPAFELRSVVKTEKTSTDAEDMETKPDITQKVSTDVETLEGYILDQNEAPPVNSVIVESNSAVQITSNLVIDNSVDCGREAPNFEGESILPRITSVAGANEVTEEDPDFNPEGNTLENDQAQGTEYDDEQLPENVFQSFEFEEEKKVAFQFDIESDDIPKEINSANINKNCDGSDIFVQEESIPFNSEGGVEGRKKNRIESVTSSSASASRVTRRGPGYKRGGTKKMIAVSPTGSGKIRSLKAPTERVQQIGEARNFGDLKSLTYTDLQPATNSKVLQDLGIPQSMNFNNYMEVDGIKIFFNNANVRSVPLEPIIKFTSGLKADVTKVQNYVKSESEPRENDTLVESVIHLVSGMPQKNDFPSETFPNSSSLPGDGHMDLRNLSPLTLNIRADESMPARGELSEQESLGAENSTWGLYHSEVSSPKSSELFAAAEDPALNILKYEKSDEPPKTFKCALCSEEFTSLKDRRLHRTSVHDTSRSLVTPRKPKTFVCTHCKEKFTSLRDRRRHVIQNHYFDSRNIDKIKQEREQREEVEIRSENGNVDVSEVKVKVEADEPAVKKETSMDGESNKGQCDVTKSCPRCNATFTGMKKLTLHLKEVHGVSRHSCGTCSETFDTDLDYKCHLRIHPIECNQCGKMFNRTANLKLHMRRHLVVKPYLCTQCPKSFITRQKLDEHLNGHSGNKPLKCPLCDSTFSRHSNLIQHRNIHHLYGKKKVKDFVCRCGEVFHSKRKLEWHKEVHDTKPKTCPFCSLKFIHSNSVTRHIRRSHIPSYLPNDKKDENIPCPVCGKIYLRSSLIVHMRVHNGEKPFVCKICNKRFTTKWNLELHNWTHQSRNNMPFKCTICKSAFFREVDYVAHINSHRNYRPFTCNICGQKFIRKYNCLRHQDEHRKEKKFLCTVSGCGKSFHRSYYLKDHMKVHTGVRPHTCHICGKASTTKSNHNKHVRIHDTREPLNTEN